MTETHWVNQQICFLIFSLQPLFVNTAGIDVNVSPAPIMRAKKPSDREGKIKKIREGKKWATKKEQKKKKTKRILAV